jgi:hypothetical protein
MTTTPTLKIDDDLTSETDSPRLPLIEISEVVSTPASDTLRPQSAEAEEIEEEHVMQLDTLIDVDVKSESGMIASEADVSPQSSQAIQSSHNTDTIPKKRGRGRKSQMLNLASWPNSAEEPILTGESSSQEGVNNTARPREARKRLKLVGGYYNKLPRHREDLQKPTEIKSDTLIDNAGGSVSRGTSLAADDVVAEVCIVNGSQSEKILGMSSSPPPSSISEATAASNAPMSGPSRRMTPAAPLQSSPSKLKHASGEAVSADANNDVGNNEFCETCQGVGHFICCDGCPRSFHFACINPPLDIDELPNSIGDASDTWYCNVCRGAGKGKKKEKQNRGLFAPLIRHVEEENPTIFALPQDIRNYFKGVATANDGSYVNTAMLRPIKINKFGVASPYYAFNVGKVQCLLNWPSRHHLDREIDQQGKLQRLPLLLSFRRLQWVLLLLKRRARKIGGVSFRATFATYIGILTAWVHHLQLCQVLVESGCAPITSSMSCHQSGYQRAWLTAHLFMNYHYRQRRLSDLGSTIE